MALSADSRLRRPWFWVKLAAAIFLGLPLTLLVLLAAINCCDETPTPKSIAASEFKIDDIPPEQNGYYALVGMIAPAGKNPHAWGREYVRLINEFHITPERQRADMKPLYRTMGDSRLQLEYRNPFAVPKTRTNKRKSAPDRVNPVRKKDEFCPKEVVRCLPEYARQAVLIDKTIAENRELLARYRSRYRYPHFREMTFPEPAAPLPHYNHLPHDLVRAAIGLESVRGNDAGAVRALADDTRHWRLVLREGRHLLSKLVAERIISDNARLAAELIASRPLSRQDIETLQSVFTPLDANEQSLQEALQTEFAMIRWLVTGLQPRFGTTDCWNHLWTCIVAKNTYQPDATANLMYADFERGLALTRLSAAEYIRHMEKRPSEPEFSIWRWHMVYNPVGKLLANIGNPYHAGNAGRLHNLGGMLRLVLLRIEIRKQALPDSKIEGLLASSAHKDPYTGGAMKWDARARAIYFMGMRRSKPGTPPLLTERIEVRI